MKAPLHRIRCVSTARPGTPCYVMSGRRAFAGTGVILSSKSFKGTSSIGRFVSRATRLLEATRSRSRGTMRTQARAHSCDGRSSRGGLARHDRRARGAAPPGNRGWRGRLTLAPARACLWSPDSMRSLREWPFEVCRELRSRWVTRSMEGFGQVLVPEPAALEDTGLSRIVDIV
jgi:hypothetical protein